MIPFWGDRGTPRRLDAENQEHETPGRQKLGA